MKLKTKGRNSNLWLALFLSGYTLLAKNLSSIAQIIPDDTLGNESSVVSQINETLQQIEGGALRGENLFHSFLEFSINEGNGVYFSNPSEVLNIFSRVTGNNISNILGTLGVSGNANLYFVNPNGILFGPNAQLDIAGSFVASSGSGFILPNGLEYSAINPQAPPLLTVNTTAPVGLILEGSEGIITNKAQLTAVNNLTLAGNQLDLQGQIVAQGDLTLQALEKITIRDTINNPFIALSGNNLLVQGNQQIDIFTLNHPNSGLFAMGNLTLRSPIPVISDASYWSGGNFQVENLEGNLGDLNSFNNSVIQALGDVSFDNYQGTSLHIIAGGSVNAGTIIINNVETDTYNNRLIQEDVILTDGTEININGSQRPTLDIKAGTTTVASPLALLSNYELIDLSFTPSQPQLADISINEIQIGQPKGLVFLSNQYQPNSASQGNIEVNTINTDDGVFTGINEFGDPIFLGNSGDIIIDSRNNINLNASLLNASSGTGDAGDIYLLAQKEIIATNEASIGSSVRGSGEGGDIKIQTKNLSMTDGSVVTSTSLGAGKAGDVTIIASESVNISRPGTGGFPPSGFFSQTAGSGDGGNLTIITKNLTVRDGAQIAVTTFGNGNGGNLTIKAEESIDVSGDSIISDDGFIINTVLGAETQGNGDGGTLTIETSKLTVRNGANINAATFGAGKGGNLIISAEESIELTTNIPDTLFNSGLFVNTEAEGDGGNLIINTGKLIVQDGAIISSEAIPESEFTGIVIEDFQSQAGDIIINATESVEVKGTFGLRNSVIISSTFGGGKAGNIEINSPSLSVTDGGQVLTSTFGDGNGGNLTIKAEESINVSGESIVLDDGSIINTILGAETQANGDAGTIKIETAKLTVSNGGIINAATFGTGEGGDLIISASESIELKNAPSDAPFDTGLSVESLAGGEGGELIINTGKLIIKDGTTISSAAYPESDFTGIVIEDFQSQAGDIKITATESIEIKGTSGLRNSNIISSTFGGGKAGNIEINTNSLFLTYGGEILAQTGDRGNAGNIILNVQDSLLINGGNSGIFANATPESTGKGGNINLQTPELLIENGGIISVNSQGEGEGGSITISNQNLNLNQGTISAETTSGDGGNINLTVNEFLTMRNNSQISTTAGNEQTGGNGGNIDIFARYIFAIPEENNDITANAFTGKGGQIFIATEAIFGIEPRDKLTDFSDITASSELGVDGIIEITRLNVDPLEGLTNLPSTPAEVKVAQGCEVGGEGSVSFYDLGKGGLPAQPTDFLRIKPIPWIPLTTQTQQQSWNLTETTYSVFPATTSIQFKFSCQQF